LWRDKGEVECGENAGFWTVLRGILTVVEVVLGGICSLFLSYFRQMQWYPCSWQTSSISPNPVASMLMPIILTFAKPGTIHAHAKHPHFRQTR